MLSIAEAFGANPDVAVGAVAQALAGAVVQKLAAWNPFGEGSAQVTTQTARRVTVAADGVDEEFVFIPHGASDWSSIQKAFGGRLVRDVFVVINGRRIIARSADILLHQDNVFVVFFD